MSAMDYSEYMVSIASWFISSDDTWISYGFKKRPKRGSLYNRFINKEQLAIERFINREIFIFCIYQGAKHLSDLGYDKDLIYITFIRSMDFMISNGGFYCAFDFENNQEMYDFFSERWSQYVKGEDINKYLYEEYESTISDAKFFVIIIKFSTFRDRVGVFKEIYSNYGNNIVDDIVLENFGD